MKKNIILLLLVSATAVAQQDSTFVEPVHLREIPKHNLAIDIGITEPVSNYNAFAGSGLSVGLTYERYKNKDWGTSIALRHQSNRFVFREANIILEEPSTSYTHTSLAVGPVYTHTTNRFQIDIAPRLGAILLNRPNDGRASMQINEEMFAPINLDKEASKNSAFYGELTVRFNYYFRRSVQVYFAPTYTTALGKPYRYKAFPANESINPSNLIFNLGVKITLGPAYSNSELRDDSF
jgi:hypothetical protein